MAVLARWLHRNVDSVGASVFVDADLHRPFYSAFAALANVFTAAAAHHPAEPLRALRLAAILRSPLAPFALLGPRGTGGSAHPFVAAPRAAGVGDWRDVLDAAAAVQAQLPSAAAWGGPNWVAGGILPFVEEGVARSAERLPRTDARWRAWGGGPRVEMEVEGAGVPMRVGLADLGGLAATVLRN
mmetsp:Transcript_20143/g.49947  ORF Transcript_20143/g.49947 Transcript_20143/m.49947 type:complete len:185 (-) Transcript_20143:1280-1834(-)